MLTFAEEMLLFALDDKEGVIKPLPQSALKYTLAGAVLMDLALHNRIDTDLQHLRVVNTAPTGDVILDGTLKMIESEKETHAITHWLNQLVARSKDLQDQILYRLIDKGILKLENRRILWVFDVRRYPMQDNREVKEVKTRLHDIVVNEEIPEARDVVLISLINACSLLDEIFTEEELEKYRQRIEMLSKMDLIGQEVARSIREIAQAMELAMPMMI
jgi:golgi phosphoprotein 3